MYENETVKKLQKWQEERTGQSPLMGNHPYAIRNEVIKGTVTMDVIDRKNDGIILVAYSDKNN